MGEDNLHLNFTDLSLQLSQQLINILTRLQYFNHDFLQLKSRSGINTVKSVSQSLAVNYKRNTIFVGNREPR